MATVTVTMTSRFPIVAAAVAAKAAAATAKAAHDIEAHAKARAPVDTGLLKNSIGASAMSPLSWRVDSPVAYAVYVEMGTSKMSARPHLIPALETVRPSYIAAMKALTT